LEQVLFNRPNGHDLASRRLADNQLRAKIANIAFLLNFSGYRRRCKAALKASHGWLQRREKNSLPPKKCISWKTFAVSLTCYGNVDMVSPTPLSKTITS